MATDNDYGAEVNFYGPMTVEHIHRLLESFAAAHLFPFDNREGVELVVMHNTDPNSHHQTLGWKVKFTTEEE